MEHKTSSGNIYNETRRFVQFNGNDKYGRQIGAYVLVYEQDFTSITEPNPRHWWRTAPGHYFCAYVQATRTVQGKQTTYGASQSPKLFATAAERDSYVAKRLEDSKRKAETK